MRDAYVLGVGMHPFGKFPDLSLRELARVAGLEALRDSGLNPKQIEACYCANALGGLLTGQECIRGQILLRELGIAGPPVINVENACAGGATAFHMAVFAVRSGYCDVALALGAEKMFVGDTGRTLAALASAADVELTRDMGLQFTAVYAMRMQKHLAAGWINERHLADVTVKSHRSGVLNPYAQHRKEVTAAEVLASRRIAGPITLLMCTSISDGAAAAIVVSEAVARRMAGSGPLVKVRASVLRSGPWQESGAQVPSASVTACRMAYEQAGLGPEDVSLVECHDATAPGELVYYADLGFCAPDEIGHLLDSGATGPGGRSPFNPSGGLASRGHPVGATGLAQVAEGVWHLRGQAGSRQVAGARVALLQNSGGWVEGDSAAGAVHILSV